MKFLMVLVCLVAVSAQAAEYNIVDLGTFGGESEATSINNNGQIVGYSYTESGEMRAFYTSSTIQSTDNLGSGGFLSSFAVDINNNGQIIVNTLNENGRGHAFTTIAGQPISSANDLGSFVAVPAAACYASGINDNGQIVGQADTSFNNNTGSSIFHAFRISFGQTISLADDLGTLGGKYSSASAINNKGEVVGWSYCDENYNDQAHAYRTSANQPITVADDLGTLGGLYSYATGINDIGQVIGYSQNADGDLHAFCTDPYQPITDSSDIPCAENETITLYDINNLGQMVGLSQFEHGNGISEKLFLYNGKSRQELSSLLNNDEWVLFNATGINDLGQIVGAGFYQDGIHAYLMTPVPEPSSLIMLLCCFMAFIMKFKK